MKRGHHFIGISLPDWINDELFTLQKQLNVYSFYKKVTGKDDFHITLLFLGGWDHEKKVHLWEDLHQLKISPFSLTLSNLGTFGNKEFPRVIWTGIEHSDEFSSLQLAITELAARRGFPVEKRPFRPHITLAKAFSGRDAFPLKQLPVPKITWNVNEIELFLIKPGKSPMYESISKISLSR